MSPYKLLNKQSNDQGFVISWCSYDIIVIENLLAVHWKAMAITAGTSTPYINILWLLCQELWSDIRYLSFNSYPGVQGLVQQYCTRRCSENNLRENIKLSDVINCIFDMTMLCIENVFQCWIYRQTSDIRCTKPQNLNVSRHAVTFAQSIKARC